MPDLKKTTYDVSPERKHFVPAVGQYMVGIGKKGITCVWLIRGVRIIRPDQQRTDEHGHRFIRYGIQYVPQPGLMDVSVYKLIDYRVGDQIFQTARVWVRGEPSVPFFRHPAKKKQQ